MQKIIDSIFIFSMISIWFLLVYNALLTYFGYKYSREIEEIDIRKINTINNFPFVSILVPAHNEEIVIERTIKSLLSFDYPKDKYEIIVINDNSSDETGKVLESMQKKYFDRNLHVINTDKKTGGKGKSNALNIGYKKAKGELIAIYDADNTPEPMALKLLVYEAITHKEYGAVIGKFRTRNKKRNILTKFINIEGIAFQWMAQGGRFRLFGLCTIPGTNFILKKEIIEKVGGWDVDAIAEDTEISIRIYQLGYKIGFMPLATTWEQEPETIKIWFKQRTRWVKGNIYVLFKYIKHPVSLLKSKICIDIFYYFAVYMLFLISLILSDLLFVFGLFFNLSFSYRADFSVIWILSYIMFIVQVAITLSIEKREVTKENLVLVALSYFTYCQMWLIVTVKGIYVYLRDKLLRRENTWYKTERFQ